MACRRIACRRARRPISVVMSRLVSATSVSLPYPRSGEPNARHLPCPGPTYACSRRRQPLCCEHIFACTPWRFRNARPAARLRRIVGPLSTLKAQAECHQTRLVLQSLESNRGKTVGSRRPCRTLLACLWYNVRYRSTFAMRNQCLIGVG